jgi:hypothetical protein
MTLKIVLKLKIQSFHEFKESVSKAFVISKIFYEFMYLVDCQNY